MSNDDDRSTIHSTALPREFVHDLRNCLGVAVATADLLLHGANEGSQVTDLEKIREACLRAVSVLDRWDVPAATHSAPPRSTWPATGTDG